MLAREQCMTSRGVTGRLFWALQLAQTWWLIAVCQAIKSPPPSPAPGGVCAALNSPKLSGYCADRGGRVLPRGPGQDLRHATEPRVGAAQEDRPPHLLRRLSGTCCKCSTVTLPRPATRNSASRGQRSEACFNVPATSIETTCYAWHWHSKTHSSLCQQWRCQCWLAVHVGAYPSRIEHVHTAGRAEP